MLTIATKISIGEWKGGWLVWGSDGDVAFEVEDEDGEMVDDFGYDLIKKPSSSSRTSSSDGARLSDRIPGSWTELD